MRTFLVADEKGVVLVKHADQPDAATLASEGRRLMEAAHPGVARVVESGPTRDGWELRLAHEGVPVSSLRSLSPSLVATIVSQAATTLADLHDRGIVHGRLDASSILWTPSGCAMVCEFGTPPGDRGGLVTPSDDVAALGAIVVEALDRGVLDTNDPRLRRQRRSVAHELALRAVASDAGADPPTRRPPIRRLAGELAQLADTSRRRRRPAAPIARRSASPGGVSVALLPPILALSLVLVVLALRWPAHAARPAPPTPPHTATEVPAGPTLPTAPNPACVATVGSPTRAGDCPNSVAVDGNVVTADGHPYVVGVPGDKLVVGDWDCDGDMAAALLRPSSGEVLVFADFADGATLAATTARSVDGAVDFAFSGVSDGCPSLGVRDGVGVRTHLE